MSDLLIVEKPSSHVRLVLLNRPDKRHAINGAMAAALESFVREVEEDDDVWAVVLAANGGPTFCAGADLSEVAAGRGASLVTSGGGFAGFVEARRTKPWIAAIEGSALGGGLEIALACDLRIVAHGSLLGLPEAARGLIAAAGGLKRLQRSIPKAIAMEMVLTGRPLTAARAIQFGLVNAAVDAGEVRAAALDLADTICGNAPLAVRESKHLIDACWDADEMEMDTMANEAVGRLMQTEDFYELPKAFVEKRPPCWQGR